MDILLVSAELSPYARGSETGDVVAGLSKALRQLGHRVTLALPRHPGFEAGGLLMARRLTPLSIGGADLTVLDNENRSALDWAKGVFLATHPAEPKPTSIKLITELLTAQGKEVR